MKILLIYPYFLEERIHAEEIRTMPIGIYYVAAMLKEQGYEIEIFNGCDAGCAPEAIEAILRERPPDIIGFSILNANRWGGIEIARMAKCINPDITIVFGGVGATFLWEHLLTHFKEIDFIVMGEGEYTFRNLVRSLEQGNKDFKDVNGIAFRSNEEIVRNPPDETISDLDVLPIPAKYFTYNQVASSRGCTMECTFCGSPAFWGRKVRFRSAKHFIEELGMLYQKGITFFYFADDTFTVNKRRVIEICRAIIQTKLMISWYAIARVDHVDEEILYWMRLAGCIQISYGVESGSDIIRNFLNKKISKDQIKRAFALTTRYGILARAYFIYGSPGETWKTIQETLDLIHEIQPLSVIFYILDIFPGTALYDEFKERCHVTDDIWLKRIEDIPYCEMEPALPSDLILAFGQRLRTDFYGNVHQFAKAVQLIDKKELYPLHADFLSRLGMTFSHGDYSRVDHVQGKDLTAEMLFQRALAYYPDQRAFLGLAILKQKQGDFQKAIQFALKGIRYFPENKDLNICLGISYMNMGEYNQALSYLLKFQDLEETKPYIIECYHKLDVRVDEDLNLA
ncbi:MAG: cobalamin-dependent protein [Deltaproteobacteria bacterium]|nr:cobalamin-dependent protein [Deltaproteobacteria bacterium]